MITTSKNNFRESAENSQLRVHTAFGSIQMPETNNKAITTHNEVFTLNLVGKALSQYVVMSSHYTPIK